LAASRLDPKEVHELLTLIVDETQAACEEVRVDLLAVPAAGETPNLNGAEVGTE